MTTVSRYNPPVGEEEVEDGITSLQRKMLYALIVARYVPVPREADSGYSIAKALGFNPALTREVGENLKVLVGLGLVKETSIIAPSPDYNNIPVRAPVGYAPVYDASAGLSVPRVAEGRPVVAWLCLYGSLAFEENRTPTVRVATSRRSRAPCMLRSLRQVSSSMTLTMLHARASWRFASVSRSAPRSGVEVRGRWSTSW